jgi:hypothetical protein
VRSSSNPNHARSNIPATVNTVARSNIPTTENTLANLQTQTAVNSPKASWTAEGCFPLWFADTVAV